MKQLRILPTLLLATTASLSPAAPDTLGKLGQAVKSARIFASPSTRSRIYYTAKTYEYLVVNEAPKKGWKSVFMSNGQYGYVDAEAVAVLPYNVVTKKPVAAAPVPTRGGRAVGSQSSRGAVAEFGLKFIGTPYQWGGNDIMNGIDCSAFVKDLYGRIGVDLPRTAAEQALVGKPITRYEDLQKGDRLYFWDAKRGKIGHTGLYLGNGYFVHSSSGKKGVSTDALTTRWQRILVSARR